MPTNKPAQLIIRSYQVGFGDCFLLTFRYEGAKPVDRHVLVDFGSTGMPDNAAGSMEEVATQIDHDCGGKLTAVIATHRHADHINGFATSKNQKGSGDIIRALKPELVSQPWTEDPSVPPDATAPGTKKSFRAALDGMHSFAAHVQEEAKRLGPVLSARARAQLDFLGEENIANRSAVDNLMTMGQRQEYLHYGKATGLAKLLPGVKIHVLGPPTPEQYPDIEKQRSKDKDEFWHLLGASASRMTAKGGIVPFDVRKFGAPAIPPEARWFAQRIRAAHVAQRLEIVRHLDDQMNNTSLILLFEIGKKKFLFPGDAQIENWNYALKDSPDAKSNVALLADTDFYKVGHHGSLNATPKTLWNLFKKKNAKNVPDRLNTAVSTMTGKHGNTAANTEVPRRTLVAELEKSSVFFTTQKLTKKQFSETMTFDC
jgi:ribonuclease BN (tRNA processing enzyme)